MVRITTGYVYGWPKRLKDCLVDGYRRHCDHNHPSGNQEKITIRIRIMRVYYVRKQSLKINTHCLFHFLLISISIFIEKNIICTEHFHLYFNFIKLFHIWAFQRRSTDSKWRNPSLTHSTQVSFRKRGKQLGYKTVTYKLTYSRPLIGSVIRVRFVTNLTLSFHTLIYI